MNTKIVFDGYVVKTKAWGLYTINASGNTWLKGRIEASGKIIWVSAHSLYWIFDRTNNNIPQN